MPTTWDEAEIQRHIDDEIEESLELDYKAANALAKSDGKKTEITKDVSAMANSAGGTIIYGLKEHPTERHRAEKIDPIDHTQFSKEWLEHVINNIRPRLSGVIIHPVSLSTGPNDVVYVAEIPQSHTAHQAADKRYYKRFNFESVAMEDFEIRDIINRVSTPDASVRFSFRRASAIGDRVTYVLLPFVKNEGNNVIRDFKLTFTFPRMAAPGGSIIHASPNIHIRFTGVSDYFIDYHSAGALLRRKKHWRRNTVAI